MKRVMLVVSYDGTNYHGWQIQQNGITIESELNRCLTELLGEDVIVSGASRTDTGVHALCNLAVFDTEARIPAEKISFALNQRLPDDIRIRKSMEVPLDFHPRYEATEKTYEYRIWNDRFPNAVRRMYTHFNYYSLDISKMQQAASYLKGEHDFKSFCSVAAQVTSTVREITDIVVYAEGDNPQTMPREIVIRVSGYGFLYNMVRIIAGTLMEVGRGSLEPEAVRDMLLAKDRAISGPTAPACGLTLVKYRFLDEKNLALW